MKPETPNTPEQTLIRKSRLGDRHAFEQLIGCHRERVYRTAFRLLADSEEARDATQEVFIRAWHNIPRFVGEEGFATWLYRIASNHCYDVLRRRKSNRQATAVPPASELLREIRSDTDIHRTLCEQELAGWIRHFTGTLTPKQKLVFTLCDLEELEPGEVARITGLTPAKIKSNLYLARQAIRRKLTEMD